MHEFKIMVQKYEQFKTDEENKWFARLMANHKAKNSNFCDDCLNKTSSNFCQVNNELVTLTQWRYRNVGIIVYSCFGVSPIQMSHSKTPQ
jgi:hypothetical protein